MLWFGIRKRADKLERETKKGFESVKKDFEGVGKWLKHLNSQDERLFEALSELKREIASVNDDLIGLKEALSFVNLAHEGKQVSKKQTAVDKQTGVYAVQKAVQTPVQTGNFYEILQGLTSNERLIVFTLMGSDLKLSYEDLARLLGKERSTIRGQINSIKQKSYGLLKEMSEPSGKKRVFVGEEMKEKLTKYAKVRVKEKKKYKKLPKIE